MQVDYYQYITKHLQDIYPEDERCGVARILIEEVSGVHASLFISDKNRKLNAEQAQKLEQILCKLQSGMPLQYALGYAHFLHWQFQVTPHTLIPRPETEELVDWIANDNTLPCPRIVDIGTGSGCIAISLKKLIPNAIVEAWDFSPEALKVAKQNTDNLQADVTFRQIDVLQPLPTDIGRFDIVVSNPPYVMDSEKIDMQANVLLHEPHSALFVPDDNPLIFYRKIASDGHHILSGGGKLFFEINALQAESMQTMLAELGYKQTQIRKDISGKDRMTKSLLI